MHVCVYLKSQKYNKTDLTAIFVSLCFFKRQELSTLQTISKKPNLKEIPKTN